MRTSQRHPLECFPEKFVFEYCSLRSDCYHAALSHLPISLTTKEYVWSPTFWNLSNPASVSPARTTSSAPCSPDNGTTLSASGSVAGLGNDDVTVLLNARGTGTIVCTNPAGNVAPGQTRDVNVSGSQTITDVKNGRVNFNVTTAEPVAPPDACPNPKWTARVTNVDFNSATLIVQQGGETVLTSTKTF
jgi:hypothetical protein